MEALEADFLESLFETRKLEAELSAALRPLLDPKVLAIMMVCSLDTSCTPCSRAAEHLCVTHVQSEVSLTADDRMLAFVHVLSTEF